MFDLSVVIPVFNEEANLPMLLEQLHGALLPMGRLYEVVIVDDGSTDGSFTLLERMARIDPTLTVVRFRRNFGQTPAMQAGIDIAQGRVIVTMDADLQNDPADIPRLVQKLQEGFDLVVGWRSNRQDAFLNRRLPSMIANRLISLMTNVRLHDYGCTLKAITADLAKQFRLYGEMHRFIPAVAAFIGARIVEMPVNHRPRQHGTSKYGIGRTLRVVLDLMTVRFIQNYLTRPMQVFGSIRPDLEYDGPRHQRLVGHGEDRLSQESSGSTAALVGHTLDCRRRSIGVSWIDGGHRRPHVSRGARPATIFHSQHHGRARPTARHGTTAENAREHRRAGFVLSWATVGQSRLPIRV